MVSVTVEFSMATEFAIETRGYHEVA